MRAGYRSLTDLLELDEQKVRQLGVEVDADVRRVVQMVSRLQQEHRNQSSKMDALYMDADMASIRVWLEKRGLGEWAPTFEQHQISFEILGDLSLELLKEMGLVAIGPRLAVFRAIEQWRDEGRVNDQQVWVLDSELRVLLDVCGACERIKTTLMSVSWRVFSWQCITVYLLILPWGIVADFGAWVIPSCVLTAYFVIAGEGVAHYIEEPFGHHEDHLDLDRITGAIDRSVTEVLEGENSAKAAVEAN